MAIETNELIDVQNLTPFKKFIMSIGAIPTSYLDSMSYAELLTWFCNYLQNTVIPVVNNNGEAVEELQDFVSNYFNNLDVTEEIENKLDKMAEDGTLTALIKEYIDPINEAFQTTITERVNNQDELISGIENMVQSSTSGSPLVASSTAGMTDTSKVYVNTTDGKWYYYDGDSWEIGGTYQSTELADGSVTLHKLADDTSKQYEYITSNANDYGLDKKYDILDLKFNSGKKWQLASVTNIASKVTDATTSCTEFFQVPSGEVISLLYKNNKRFIVDIAILTDGDFVVQNRRTNCALFELIGNSTYYYAITIPSGDGTTYYDAINIVSSNNLTNTTAVMLNGLTNILIDESSNRHLVRFDDLEKRLNIGTYSLIDGTLKTTKKLANIHVLATTKNKIDVEFKCSGSNSIYLLINNDATKYYYTGIYNHKGEVWSCYYDQSASQQEGSMSIPVTTAWSNSTQSSTFKLSKNGTTVSLYVKVDEDWELCFTYTSNTGCIGFVGYAGIILTNCYVTTYDNVGFEGLYDRVYNLETNNSDVFHNISNMKTLFIGDSITESNFRANVNWVDNIVNWFNIGNYYNGGLSGTGIMTDYGDNDKWIDNLDTYDDDYDLILIMGDMNDFSHGTFTSSNIGQYGDSTTSTFYGTMKVYLEAILNKYPLAKIGWITSTPRNQQLSSTDYLHGKNSIFETGDNIIKEMCNNYSIPVLDLYHESNLYPWLSANNEEYFKAPDYQSGDGVHPNDAGQLVISYKIYDFIKRNF